jgi:hypothetical protein
MADDSVLIESIQMIKAGRKAEAQLVLEPYIQANPHNIQAWMWEAELFPADTDKIKVLEICLEHNPEHPQVKRGLEILRTKCGIHAPLVTTPAPAPVEIPAVPVPLPAPDAVIAPEPPTQSPAAAFPLEKATSQAPRPERTKPIKHPDWLRVTGIVETSEVSVIRSQVPMYYATITAMYIAAGKDYQVKHSGALKKSVASMDAEILVSNYPPGSSVMVRYDPKHPNRAIVDDWDPADTKRKLKQFKDKPEVRKVLSRRHRNRMWSGLGWAAGGIAATVVSILVFSGLGVGYYVVFGGAIVYGLFTFISGLVSWLWYWD